MGAGCSSGAAGQTSGLGASEAFGVLGSVQLVGGVGMGVQ